MSEDPTFLALFQFEKPVRLKAGETLFEVGDPARSMYVVKTGSIRLHRGGITLEIVEPGGLFGEMAIIDHLERSASATAITDCELAEVDEAKFVSILQQTPMFGLNVLRLVTRRLRATDGLLAGLGLQ